MKIVIAEDETSLAAALSRMVLLAWPEAQIMIARDGFEAGVQVARNRPDLLLLDVNLPGLDGFWVCRMLRTDALLAGTRILAVSGDCEPELPLRIRGAGADDFLAKPFDHASLIDRIGVLLSRPAAAGAS